MNKQIFITLVLLLFAIAFKPQNSFAQTPPIEIDARTFMLSNESPGYLIDNLIAAGYRDSSLYTVMQYLQPLSGGVIPQWFMDSLAACPAKSDIFTAELWNFSDHSNNPIGIAEDGTLVVAPIYGSDLSGKEGYTTYNDTLVPVSLKLFTEAIGPEFYIDAAVRTADGIKTYYQAFAIAWSMGSTFVLTNEGGLIDDLIRAGNGDKNLYQTLEILKPKSGGVISDEFMATLANCKAGSEIFTIALKNFSRLNNPVCVNTDGTLKIKPIFGKNYFDEEGYNLYPKNQQGYTAQLFTYTTSPEYYIDAGVKSGQSRYKAFAIAWKASTTFVLSNEGGLIDYLIARGYGNSNLWQTLVTIASSSGGVISEEFLETLALCPAGSGIFTKKLNTCAGMEGALAINTDGTVHDVPLFGKDYFQKPGYKTYPNIFMVGVGREVFTHASGTEYYIDAGSNGGITYQAFAIAWSMEAAPTTFVLSNEGGLIDYLIAAGYGSGSLYDALLTLQSSSGGVIADEFLDKLATCPEGSEIFTAKLRTFAGLNNPVCVNSDGTLRINPIFGKDYFGKEGYTTYPEGGNELFTYAISPDYYIDAGQCQSGGGGCRYLAFAIAWSDSTVSSIFDETNEQNLFSVSPNPASDYIEINLDRLTKSSRLEKSDRIKIYNTFGKSLIDLSPALSTGEGVRIDVSHLPVGLYFIQIGNYSQIFLILR